MFFVRNPEQWSRNQQVAQHTEALQFLGERVLIAQVWRPIDHKRGLVTRCSVCADGPDQESKELIASVYKQPGATRNHTGPTNCYGTGFTGGFKATWDSYALFEDGDNVYREGKEGVTERNAYKVQLPPFPAVRNGDMLIRFYSAGELVGPEEQRYIIGDTTPRYLRTGAGLGNNELLNIGYICTADNMARSDVRYEFTPKAGININLSRNANAPVSISFTVDNGFDLGWTGEIAARIYENTAEVAQFSMTAQDVEPNDITITLGLPASTLLPNVYRWAAEREDGITLAWGTVTVS